MSGYSSSGGAAGSGGHSPSGGAAGSGGHSPSGGAAGSGGHDHGAGGTAGAGGVGGTGGDRYVCTHACTGIPTTCPNDSVLIIGEYGADDCCPHCKPRSTLTYPSCIIDGHRYDQGAIVESGRCGTCICVDGHVGECTGACLENDAGPVFPSMPLPDCGLDGKLQEACSECGPADGCTAYEYKCYTTGPNCTQAAFTCGAGKKCFTDVCADAQNCG